MKNKKVPVAQIEVEGEFTNLTEQFITGSNIASKEIEEEIANYNPVTYQPFKHIDCSKYTGKSIHEQNGRCETSLEVSLEKQEF